MGWTHQLTLLLAAFGLSSVIGLERELRQKNAGRRTHTLVGVGAAVLTIVSKDAWNLSQRSFTQE